MSKAKNAAKAAFEPEKLLPIDCDLSAEDFAHVGPDAERRDEIVRPSISYWRDAMRRLKENKVAVACMIFLVVLILFALIVPLVSPYTMSEQHLQHPNEPMFFRAEDGHMHIFGTDDLGRDLFMRLWLGTRTSLYIAVSVVVINLLIGVIYGALAGYFGGWIDNIMMRFIEIIIGIPYLIIVILLSMIMKSGVTSLIIAYAIVGWVGSARLTRGQVLSLRTQEFIIAAHALGSSPWRLIGSHIVPNLLSVLIVNLTLAIPSAIFTEAFLSYIGLGVPLPHPSLGNLAQEGTLRFMFYPQQLLLPAIVISLTMLSFNMLGDGLRDALDPRLRT
ncbi:MAG: ABC transporter permease [Christensenellaceae bacterium]|nr:ABC transporter permease [Christensenellaceae bacterium]